MSSSSSQSSPSPSPSLAPPSINPTNLTAARNPIIAADPIAFADTNNNPVAVVGGFGSGGGAVIGGGSIGSGGDGINNGDSIIVGFGGAASGCLVCSVGGSGKNNGDSIAGGFGGGGGDPIAGGFAGGRGRICSVGAGGKNNGDSIAGGFGGGGGDLIAGGFGGSGVCRFSLYVVDGGKEHGSTLRNKKVKSLLSRWINYSSTDDSGMRDDDSHNVATINNDLFIWRDTVMTSYISHGKSKLEWEYIVLGVYDKYYNKWFMTEEDKRLGTSVTINDKKKFKIAICMIEEGVLEKYDYVCPYDERNNRNEVLRIVDGSAIITVKGKYNRRAI